MPSDNIIQIAPRLKLKDKQKRQELEFIAQNLAAASADLPEGSLLSNLLEELALHVALRLATANDNKEA